MSDLSKHKTIRAHAALAVRGFTLLELMIVLSISALIAVAASRQIKDRFEDQMARAAAEQITEVGKATAAFISQNAASLGAGRVIALSELISGNYLPASFTPSLPWSSSYVIRARRIATSPDRYEALILTSTPWLISAGKANTALVGAAVRQIGASGGMTYDNTSGAIGLNGAWTAPVSAFPEAAAGSPSPSPGEGGGLLAYYIGPSTSSLDSIYLRVDGGNAMTGNLRLGNNNIVDANSLTTRLVTITDDGAIVGTNKLHLHANSDLYLQSGNTATSRIYAGRVDGGGGFRPDGVMTMVGNVQATNTIDAAFANVSNTVTTPLVSITGDGAIVGTNKLHLHANSDLYLQSGNTATSRIYAGRVDGGGGFRPDGVMVMAGDIESSGSVRANNDVIINSLTADRSTGSLSALAPKLVEINSVAVSAHGQTVSAPSCPSGGVPGAFLIQHSAYGYVNAGRFGVDSRLTGPTGGVFTVIARDVNGDPIPSAIIPAGQWSALVRTFCAY